METKFKYSEDVRSAWPIGSTYNISKSYGQASYYNMNDLKIYLDKYGRGNVTLLDENTIQYSVTREYKVEGYIYDGEYWRPAYRYDGGWLAIDKNEVNVED